MLFQYTSSASKLKTQQQTEALHVHSRGCATTLWKWRAGVVITTNPPQDGSVTTDDAQVVQWGIVSNGASMAFVKNPT
jgi:hypothetical protein